MVTISQRSLREDDLMPQNSFDHSNNAWIRGGAW